MITIDIHTHAFPNDLANRALKGIIKLASFNRDVDKSNLKSHGNGKVKGLLQSMDKADIDMSALYSIATKPGQVANILKFIEANTSDRLVPIGSIHPDDQTPQNWLNAMKFAEIPAVKFHPMFQNFVIDDPKMDPIYKACCDLQLGVIFHTGKDLCFPNDPIPDRASPARIANLIRKFPDLKILAAHMGGFQMWDDVQTHLLGKNVFLETSFALDSMGEELFVKFITEHDSDKICFGTDWPWLDQASYKSRIANLISNEKLRDKIMFSNASRFLKLSN